MRLLKNHLGAPGIISILALAFAMFGGAYAASNNGGGGDSATASKAGPPGPRGPRGKRGKPGPAGAQGPAGPAGQNGQAGPKGDAGPQGAKGATGANGAGGKSVLTGTEPAGTEKCEGLGGSWVEVEGSGVRKYACNGKAGSPWTELGVLPSGESLKGVWGFGLDPTAAQAPGGRQVFVSFPLPLAEGLDRTQVHYINPSGKEVIVNEEFEEEQLTSTKCKGTAEEPSAEPGNLCVYAKFTANVAQPFTVPASEFLDGRIVNPVTNEVKGGGTAPFGFKITFQYTGDNASAAGSWAVTAPEAP